VKGIVGCCLSNPKRIESDGGWVKVYDEYGDVVTIKTERVIGSIKLIDIRGDK
jgi:hypothetical protein